MSDRLPMLRGAMAAVLFAGLLAAGALGPAALAADEEPAPEPGASFRGEYCAVTCGRFKEDTCEIWDEAAPALDLEHLSRGSDPLALMARRVRALEQGGDACRDLVDAGRERLAVAQAGARWREHRTDLDDPERVRALLLRAGRRSLAALARQREAGVRT